MWLYVQSSGNMYDKDGVIAWTGYSGHGEGLNNPDLDHVHGLGPLPRGKYTIGAPFHSPHTGPNAMRLIPDGDNEMHGRGDFECHGDNDKGDKSASNGCIVKSPAAKRLLLWNSGDHRLQVIAERNPSAV